MLGDAEITIIHVIQLKDANRKFGTPVLLHSTPKCVGAAQAGIAGKRLRLWDAKSLSALSEKPLDKKSVAFLVEGELRTDHKVVGGQMRAVVSTDIHHHP